MRSAALRLRQPFHSSLRRAAGATHISPERTLPVLLRIPDAAAGDKSGGAPIAGSGPIVDHLASCSGAGRSGTSDGLVALSPTQAADMEAYTAMVEHKL
jgi:hypothetical protein